MGTENFFFEQGVLEVLRLYTEQFKQQGLSVDSIYLDYFGNQCPKCRAEMEVYNKTVKGIGSISSFLLLDQKKVVIYPLCNSCAKKIISRNYNPEEDKRVEEFICSKFPQFTRPILNENDKRKEISKEYKLLDKLKSG